MENNTHVRILGTCILRDTLSFSSDSGYTIDRFVQNVNPVSTVQAKKLCNEGMDVTQSEAYKTGSMSRLTKFLKRNVILEINKQVFDYLFESKSDYLIIDVISLRLPLARFMSNGEEKLLTYFPTNKPIIDELIEEGYFSADEFDIVSSEDEYFPLIEKYLPIYIDKILEQYPVDKIILVEAYPTRFYLSKNKTLSLFSAGNVRDYMRRLKFGYKIAKKLLEGCHVVEFPDYVIADENHRWGINNMHYCREYYDYTFKAFNVITKENNDKITEERKLRELKDECSMLFYSNYEDLFTGELSKLKKEVSIFSKYMDYFKKLAAEPDKINNALNYLKSHGYSHCCLYGYTQISLLYIDLFKKNNIIIDYIIENTSKKTIDGIPAVHRGNNEYSGTDVIIVCDVNNLDNIEKAIRSLTEIPVTNVYRIIE